MRHLRYFKQRTKSSCGPISVLNALRWVNRNIHYNKMFKEVKSLCKTDRNGTSDDDFDRCLNFYANKFRFKVVSKIFDYDALVSHLGNGGSAILTHKLLDGEDYHFSFWFENDDIIYGANVGMGTRTEEYGPDIFTRLAERSEEMGMWLISKF